MPAVRRSVDDHALLCVLSEVRVEPIALEDGQHLLLRVVFEEGAIAIEHWLRKNLLSSRDFFGKIAEGVSTEKFLECPTLLKNKTFGALDKRSYPEWIAAERRTSRNRASARS